MSNNNESVIKLAYSFAYGEAIYKSTLEKSIQALTYAIDGNKSEMCERVNYEIHRMQKALENVKQNQEDYSKQRTSEHLARFINQQ